MVVYTVKINMQLARRRYQLFWKVCLRAVIDVWEKYWNKHLNMDANLTAGPTSFLYRNGWKCLRNGIDPTFYNQRRRSFDEVLPWDHIDYGIKKSFLKRECEKAYQNATTPKLSRSLFGLRCSLF